MLKHCILLLGLLVAGSAHGQNADVTLEADAEAGETTVLTFTDDDAIEGSLRSPDGEFFETRKRTRHRNLIRIRRHFRREILRGVHRL